MYVSRLCVNHMILILDKWIAGHMIRDSVVSGCEVCLLYTMHGWLSGCHKLLDLHLICLSCDQLCVLYFRYEDTCHHSGPVDNTDHTDITYTQYRETVDEELVKD